MIDQQEWPSNENIVKAIHVIKEAGLQLADLGVLTEVSTQLLAHATYHTISLLRGEDKLELIDSLRNDLLAEAEAAHGLEEIENFANGEQA